MAIQHYFPHKHNILTFTGKVVESYGMYRSLPSTWITKLLHVPPVTVAAINKIINDNILKNGYYVYDIAITEEPANFLFFETKYTFLARFFPHTEKAKTETAKIQTIEQTISPEIQAAFAAINKPLEV